MQLLLVSVCLVICGSVLVSTSDPHYVIIIPNVLKEGSQEKACVTIQDLNCELHLKLELQKGDQVQEIATQDIKTTDFSHCYSFQVPPTQQKRTEWSFHVSGQGEHFKIEETKKIYIGKQHHSCIVQTDKSTYKPGDIVKARLVSVDHNFHASNEKYENIFLLDPNGNHIGQWLDVTPEHGIADLHYHLAKELRLGNYKFKVSDRCEATFTVAEYVLKRFEVHTNLPSVSFTAKSFNMEVCGSYTYGKPVQGNLDIEICDDRDNHPFCPWYFGSCDDDDDHDSEKCIKITHAKTDSNGCLSREIDLQFFNFSAEDRQHKLQIVSSLTEDGTGQTEKETAELVLMNHKKVKFEDIGYLYQRGVPYTGKIKATDKDNQPLANTKVVIVSLKSSENDTTLATLETDKDGEAHFTINTDSWTDEQMLGAGFSVPGEENMRTWEKQRSRESVWWVHPYYSESHSLLEVETRRDILPCDSDVSLEVNYHINKDQLDSKTDHISFFYFTINEGGIHSYEEYKLDITQQSSDSYFHGSFPIKIHLDGRLSPHFLIHAYTILPRGETVSGLNHYEVSQCFGNKVQLKFSEEKVHPGEKVNLEVSADAESLCSVRSLDKGYLLQYPHDNTSFATRVKWSLSSPFGFASDEFEEERLQCPENQIAFSRWHLTFDTSFLFKASNLKLITNTHVKKPEKCVEDAVAPRLSTLNKKDHRKGKEDKLKQRSPRRDFPDTWLFELVSVGSEGHTVLNLTTPDSITKWETDAVCLGNSGIGEIRNVELTTFKTYFIDLIMPYSVVQGEKFKIEAHIFSYDTKCILVAAILSDADGIHTVQDKEQGRCACKGHSNHFSWEATASKPNEIKIHVESGSREIDGDCKEDAHLVTKELRVDSIEKTLIVRARGYEEQTTETHLLYVKGTTEKVVFNLKTPDRLVPGTERAHIIALGDIMGNIVVNLENILSLPDGCAEQSVSKLSRYCYSLEYLQNSNELSPETKEKFLEHIVKGYQKQLTFKSDSGGYGLFAGDSSNAWVTALVVRTFSCVQQFIHVDEKDIQEAIHWLETKQLPSSCFDTDRNYFSYGNDEDNEVKQTALVIISLLEHRIAHNGSIVENAISCLRKRAESTKTANALAILAYAFTLFGDIEQRDTMLKRLDDLADKHSGSKHWVHTNYQYGDIETTSYVILALLSDKIIAQKDLEESAHSVRWLASQQNPWGGFSSSQDTTVALQALAKYTKATAHKTGDTTVIIEDGSGFHKEVHIDKRNSLLVQTVELPKVPGTYTASITGNGCIYIQSHLHYYSIPDEHDVHFAVNVTTNPEVCTSDAQKQFDVHVEVRYIGKRSKTNMALIKVELLSGFVPCSKSIKKLKKHSDVKRVDVLPGEIDIYLEELNHETDHFVFTIKQETRVDNLQPANVVVLDYYIPEVHAHATYNTPCSKAHCNVRASERKDCGKPSIPKEECEQKGCCYDTSIADTKWCFFHENKLIEAEEDHHSHETQEAH